MPRFRIAWAMVFVAVVAVNIAAVRAAADAHSITGALLALGAMPMAIVLAIGVLVGYQRHGSRPFLLGFELFGAIALALFAVLAAFFTQKFLGFYLAIFVDPLSKIVGPDLHFIHILVAYVALGFPQVAFALIGGFLSRKYRIAIPGRPAHLSAER